MTIVSLAVLVLMNARLEQSLKVTNILSTQTLAQNVELAPVFVLLKLFIWDNQNRRLTNLSKAVSRNWGGLFLCGKNEKNVSLRKPRSSRLSFYVCFRRTEILQSGCEFSIKFQEIDG